jgi:uncharacterized protein
MTFWGEIVPFYFGTPGKELFACLHVPESDSCRDCGVVICQPFGHEYVNSHRALRQLAARLVDAGYPVLRFDYYGCGDSSGEVTETSIAEWVINVSQAISELQQRIEVSNVCVVGLRLGASLAVLSSMRGERPASQVLWDPIVSGKSYLKQLIALQNEMLRFRPKPRRVDRPQHELEIFGFPMSSDLREGISAIDLSSGSQRVAEHVLLVQTEPSEGSDELRMRLQDIGTSIRYAQPEAPKIWLPTTDGSLLVPGRVLQSITSWLIETHP